MSLKLVINKENTIVGLIYMADTDNKVFDGYPISEDAGQVLNGIPETPEARGSDESNQESEEVSFFDGIEDSVLDSWSDVSKAVSREDFDNMDSVVRGQIQGYLASGPDVLSYPIDLNNDPNNPDNELLHSVVFKILARSNSRVGQVSINGLGKPVDVTNQNRVNSDNAAAYTGALGGALGGLYAFRAFKKTASGQLGSAAGEGLKGVAVVGAGAALGSMAVENTSLVRLRTAIELHISNPPKASYSAEWENKDIGALGGAFARGASPEFSTMGVLSGATGLAELGARGIIQAAANLPGQIGLTGDLAAGVEATSKKVANPYKEQLFKSVGFRSFEFVYKFAPRSDAELENVMKIIQKFKYYMHPENDENKLFLEYPSEFEIEYRYRGRRNEYLNKISNCALTDLDISYGNQDSYTSFKDTRGAPSEINVRMKFTELETMTNDRIGNDYRNSF